MKHLKPCSVILQPLTPKQMGLSIELRNALNERNILTTRTKKRLLTDLEEINETNVEKDRKYRRKRAVNEIFNSEVTYLNQLELVKEYFMKPIKERRILTPEEYQTMFGSIQTIYNINSELLRELRKYPENVSQAFSKIAPFFKLYSVYAFDYKKCIDILQDAPKCNLQFANFLEQQESRPEVKKKLSALLITPIQRIPRYRLLLQQVLQHTSPGNSSYALLIDSLNKVEEAASHINNLVEEQEMIQRLLELQRSLQNGHPKIIKPDRKLIKEGFLKIMPNRGSSSSKIYFVLMSDILIGCKLKKDNPSVPNSLKCLWVFPLNKCSVTEMLSKGAFKITCQDENVVVHHEHARESNDWVKVLSETIKQHVNNRRTLRKDSSSRRPAYRKQVAEYTDLGISPGQPRRKRQLTNMDDLYKSVADDTQLEDMVPSSCFPIKVTKRKAIRHEPNVPHKIPKQEHKDSLFPLRKNIVKNRTTKATTASEPNDNQDNMQVALGSNVNDVFVFGRNDQQRGFLFNMSNLVTGFGNSVKRMFGFNTD